jgi:hypothetical protein
MTELDDLAARLRRLENDRDIRQLIASYSPTVDAGDPDAAARLWATDGICDVDGWRMEGRADIHAMISSEAHQKLVAKGCCHFLGRSDPKLSSRRSVHVGQRWFSCALPGGRELPVNSTPQTPRAIKAGRATAGPKRFLGDAYRNTRFRLIENCNPLQCDGQAQMTGPAVPASVGWDPSLFPRSRSPDVSRCTSAIPSVIRAVDNA